MENNVWESEYLDAYDKVLLSSDIYLAVRDFHINSMIGCKVVLDSGCGTGNVTEELLKRGCSVYAVDTSKKALDILKRKCSGYNKNLIIYNISAESLPFKDDMFDGITSMFVAHFVEDFEGYLKENCRVLKRGGIFAFSWRASTENMNLVVESYENSLRKRGLLPKLADEMEIVRESILNKVSKSVKHTYTLNGTKKLLKETGFRNIKEKPNPYFGQCYSLLASK